MPSKHSKNSGDKHYYSYHEKHKAGVGSLKQRLGTESQLPFGYCGLSMYPADDAVVTPSGHIYGRESILEYLLTKSRELKEQMKAFEEQQSKDQQELERLSSQKEAAAIQAFQESAEGSGSLGKRKIDLSEISDPYTSHRKKHIDDTETNIKIAELQKVSPWVPQFTPAANQSTVKLPSKRPSSPFSGNPLRAKDLIPINLLKESDSTGENTSTVKYICPISRKTITNQKVVLIKPTGVYMLEQTAKELAYPTMTCPSTGKKFKTSDVLELVPAISGFSATGKVEVTKHRPTIN